MNQQNCFPPQWLELFNLLRSIATQHRINLYLVGGAIRDILVGVTSRDLDFIVSQDVAVFAAAVNQELDGKLELFEKFGTAKLTSIDSRFGIDDLDFAEARDEIYEKPGALPTVKPAQLDADLKRRDFSINAIALEVSKEISRNDINWLRSAVIDPFNGLENLENRKIRCLHVASFIDDPTRIFRAARYAGRLAAQLEGDTAALIKAAVEKNALSTISHFRKFKEIKLIILEDKPWLAFSLLAQWGVLQQMGLLNVETQVEALKAIEDIFSSDLFKDHNRKEDPEFRVGLVLRVLGFFADWELFGAKLKDFGFSKKKILAIQKDIDRDLRSTRSLISSSIASQCFLDSLLR